MKLRELTSDDEHMNYLLDKGYTKRAKELFKNQFQIGQLEALHDVNLRADKTYWPYAMQIGYNNPNDPVDDWINLYFEDVS